MIERELQEGHLGVGVRVSDDTRKGDAARVLAKHGAHGVHDYGEWSIEEL